MAHFLAKLTGSAPLPPRPEPSQDLTRHIEAGVLIRNSTYITSAEYQSLKDLTELEWYNLQEKIRALPALPHIPRLATVVLPQPESEDAKPQAKAPSILDGAVRLDGDTLDWSHLPSQMLITRTPSIVHVAEVERDLQIGRELEKQARAAYLAKAQRDYDAPAKAVIATPAKKATPAKVEIPAQVKADVAEMTALVLTTDSESVLAQKMIDKFDTISFLENNKQFLAIFMAIVADKEASPSSLSQEGARDLIYQDTVSFYQALTKWEQNQTQSPSEPTPPASVSKKKKRHILPTLAGIKARLASRSTSKA